MSRASIIAPMDAWIDSLIARAGAAASGLCRRSSSSPSSSSTLLPLGSEPAVFGLVKLNPEMFWPAIGVATARQHARRRDHLVDGLRRRARLRARDAQAPPTAAPCAGCAASARRPACCRGCRSSAIRCAPSPAGCKLPFWPCLVYMTIGKFGRYFVMTAALHLGLPGPVRALTRKRKRTPRRPLPSRGRRSGRALARGALLGGLAASPSSRGARRSSSPSTARCVWRPAPRARRCAPSAPRRPSTTARRACFIALAVRSSKIDSSLSHCWPALAVTSLGHAAHLAR